MPSNAPPCKRPGCPGKAKHFKAQNTQYCSGLCQAMDRAMQNITNRLQRAEMRRDRPRGEQIVNGLMEEIDLMIQIDELMSKRVTMRDRWDEGRVTNAAA